MTLEELEEFAPIGSIIYTLPPNWLLIGRVTGYTDDGHFLAELQDGTEAKYRWTVGVVK